SPNVSLPGSSQTHRAGSDTPYVYTGGWGLNGAGVVDAGFQYSPTFNNWSLFAAGVGVGSVGYNGPRLMANETVLLTFAVVQAGANVDLVVTASGTDITGAAVQQSVTLVNV